MKNKTLRTNSMKLKKVIAASLAISVLFAFTGCGNSSSTDNTNTKQESSSSRRKSALKSLRMSRRKPALNLQIPPAQNWTIYISRKTSFLLITKMHGTKPLVL